jgi:hypothetical protein
VFVERGQLVLVTAGSRVQLASTVEDLVLDSSVMAQATQVEPVVPGGESVYHPVRGMYVRLIDEAFANDGAVSIPPGSTLYVPPESLISPMAKQSPKLGGKDTMEPVPARVSRSSVVMGGIVVGLVVLGAAFRLS